MNIELGKRFKERVPAVPGDELDQTIWTVTTIYRDSFQYITSVTLSKKNGHSLGLGLRLLQEQFEEVV